MTKRSIIIIQYSYFLMKGTFQVILEVIVCVKWESDRMKAMKWNDLFALPE